MQNMSNMIFVHLAHDLVLIVSSVLDFFSVPVHLAALRESLRR